MRALWSSLIVVLAIQTASPEAARKVVQDEFGSVFRLNASRRNQEISPEFVTGDFDGDGKTDLAVLVSIRQDQVTPSTSFPMLTITKVLGKGASAAEAKSAQMRLSDLTQDFRDSIVLLIVHDFARTSGKASRFALLDFANNGKIKMTTSRKSLKRADVGDGPRQSPPRLRGDAILFLDAKGEGTAVYWDGVKYLWYPVE